jgi:hypothetical protein
MTHRQRMRRVESGVTRDRNREKLRRLSKEKKKIQSELHQVENQLQAYGFGFGSCGGIGGGRQQNVIKMRPTSMRCINGHYVEYGFLTPQNITFKCQVCNSRCHPGSLMFGCDICNYDLCEHCERDYFSDPIDERGLPGAIDIVCLTNKKDNLEQDLQRVQQEINRLVGNHNGNDNNNDSSRSSNNNNDVKKCPYHHKRSNGCRSGGDDCTNCKHGIHGKKSGGNIPNSQRRSGT